jgi:hypothetical protein
MGWTCSWLQMQPPSGPLSGAPVPGMMPAVLHLVALGAGDKSGDVRDAAGKLAGVLLQVAWPCSEVVVIKALLGLVACGTGQHAHLASSASTHLQVVVGCEFA